MHFGIHRGPASHLLNTCISNYDRFPLKAPWNKICVSIRYINKIITFLENRIKEWPVAPAHLLPHSPICPAPVCTWRTLQHDVHGLELKPLCQQQTPISLQWMSLRLAEWPFCGIITHLLSSCFRRCYFRYVHLLLDSRCSFLLSVPLVIGIKSQVAKRKILIVNQTSGPRLEKLSVNNLNGGLFDICFNVGGDRIILCVRRKEERKELWK